MGHPDQLAKRTFSLETSEITSGDVSWEDPPEIGLTRVQADGYLVVHRRDRIASLSWPWPMAGAYDEVLVEIKMAGDHIDEEAVERALLRRQARQVQRVAESALGLGQTPLWIVAPNLPRALISARVLTRLAAGCYLVEPSGFPFLWIAANELPLALDLVPFLVARSGRALDEFVQWVAPQKPVTWVTDLLEFLPMSPAAQEALLQHVAARDEDPEIEARRLRILQALLDNRPEVRRELTQKGREEGLEEGLRQTVRDLCEVFEIPLTPQREASLSGMDVDALTSLRQRIKRARRWEE